MKSNGLVTWERVAVAFGSILVAIAVLLMTVTVEKISAVDTDIEHIKGTRCTEIDCAKLRENINANALALGKLIAHSEEREKRIDQNIANINANIEKIDNRLDRMENHR